MLALKELLHNLKDRDWDVNPVYKIDENEARRIIEGIEGINEWIPLTKRPMTEEEREHYKERSDVECGTILDCPLPEDGQEVTKIYSPNTCKFVTKRENIQEMDRRCNTVEQAREYLKTSYILFRNDEYKMFDSEKEACEFLGVKECSVSGAYRHGWKCKGWNIIRLGNGTKMEVSE